MPPRPRLLILDCDGVLIRSERANLAYYNHLFRRFGLPAVAEEDRERLWLLHTLSTPQVIDAFFPTDLREEGREAAAALDFGEFIPCLEPEPGWPGALARLKTSMRLAVATNRGSSARAVLSAVGLLEHLDFVVTIRDVPRPKPEPDLLHAALGHFGVAPEEALYLGDSELDRRAAAAAGVPFLGFRTPAPPSVSSPAALEAWLPPVARAEDSVSLTAAFPRNPQPTKEAGMSQKDMFHPEDNVLKRGCQVSEGEVELCPCGSKKAFAKCHGAACECGSGKPKFKCCHSDEI